MKKIILLDIDGVLTSESYTQKCILDCRNENLFAIDWFDPKCVKNLNHIISETDAEIVIVSDHIFNEIKTDSRAIQLLEANGITTKRIRIADNKMPTKRDCIANEISQMKDDKYVLIDDDNFHITHQLKTNTRIGLTSEDSIHAIQILK